MTKKELVEWLEDFDDDDQVVFLYPAGDYWHHTIAKDVTDINKVDIKYSEYFEESVLVDENSNDDENYSSVIALS